MRTEQAQVKLNLPRPLKDFAESKASKFGMPLAGYIRHLIVKDVEGMGYPEFEPSERTIRAYKQALKDQKEGKLIRVGNIKKFFDEL